MTIQVELLATGLPKGHIVEMALEDCGIASFEFGLTAEEMSSGLRRLNAMMSTWPWSLIETYSCPPSGNGLPEDPSGIPDNAVQAVAHNLALLLAPTMGKTLSPEYVRAAGTSRREFEAAYATPTPAPFPAKTPRGMGNRSYGIDLPFIAEGV